MFSGRRILVAGLGDTGLSCARWLVRGGAEVVVADSRRNPPHAATVRRDLPAVPVHAGPFSEEVLRAVDLVVASPGIALRDPFLQEARSNGIPIVGDIELFAWALNARRSASLRSPEVVAITGSNGKSTVTAMVGEMCRAAGLDTVVAGNIGVPVLDALMQAETGTMPDVWVIELSSFQLETTSNLHLKAATVLNVTEDHMDRYASFADYVTAKARIFEHCQTQVLNRDDAYSRAMVLADREAFSFGLDAPLDERQWGLMPAGNQPWLARGAAPLMPLAELPLVGLHNAGNAAAALALCHALPLPDPPCLEALRRFQGLPHRVEPVAKVNGITFYDDSKGTNVGATVAALSGISRPVVLIAGGDGKGQDFGPLVPVLAAHARALVLIGRDADLIGTAVAKSGTPKLRADGMDEAVRLSFALARPGDVILLSPACASYDMFDNYVHRARAFIAAVDELKQRECSTGSESIADE